MVTNLKRRSFLLGLGSVSLLATFSRSANALEKRQGLPSLDLSGESYPFTKQELTCRGQSMTEDSPRDQVSKDISTDDIIHNLFPEDDDPDYHRNLTKRITQLRKDHPFAEFESAVNLYLINSENPKARFPYAQRSQDLTKTFLALLANNDAEIRAAPRDPRPHRQKQDNIKLFSLIQSSYHGRENAEACTVYSALAVALRESRERKPPIHPEAQLTRIMDEVYAKQDLQLRNCTIVMDVCERLNFPYATAEKIVNQESGFDNKACNKASGALGLCQMVHNTWLSMVHKLKDMTAGAEAFEYMVEAGSHLAGFIGIQFATTNPSKSPGIRKEILARREDPHDSMAFFTSLVMDNRRVMCATLGDRFVYNPCHDWLGIIAGAGRAAFIIRDAASHPKRLISEYLKDKEIKENPSVFGEPFKPYRLEQVLAAVRQDLPVVPILVAKERGLVALVDRREQLLNMGKGRPLGASVAQSMPLTQLQV